MRQIATIGDNPGQARTGEDRRGQVATGEDWVHSAKNIKIGFVL
jgi:hypothetical protein